MKADGLELDEFVQQMTKRIATSVIDLRKEPPGIGYGNKTDEYNVFHLSSPIEFELSILIKKNAKGKFSILLAEAGGNYEQESISKIKFSIDSLGNNNAKAAMKKASIMANLRT